MARGIPALHKKTISPTELEWIEATQLVMSLWKDLSPRHNNFTLNAKQIELKAALHKDLRALNGESVLKLADSGGTHYSSYPYRGMIVGAKRSDGEYLLTVILSEPEGQETWDIKERLEYLKLWQVIPVREIKINKKELVNLLTDEVVSRINISRNNTLLELKKKQEDYEKALKSRERDVVFYKKNLKEVANLIEGSIVSDLSKDDVMKELNLLKKHKKIGNAYVTFEGNIIVETRMLYVTAPDTLIEDKKSPIGRIVMNLSLSGLDKCRFDNLDYLMTNEDGDYQHPNIMNQIVCGGDNSDELNAMLRSGNFYELIDFLIVFFSLFPHDQADAHIDCWDWLDERDVRKKENPFNTTKRIWELRPSAATKKDKALDELYTKMKDFTKPTAINVPVPMGMIDNEAMINNQFTTPAMQNPFLTDTGIQTLVAEHVRNHTLAMTGIATADEPEKEIE